MDEDLAIGDMGMVDPFGAFLDVPEPSLENPEGVSADVVGPGGVAATMADVGLSASAVAISAEEGQSGSFAGDSQAFSLPADGLGVLPPLAEPPEPEPPGAFSAEGAVPPVAFPSSPAGQPSFSDAPAVTGPDPVSFLAPAVDSALGGAADPLPFLEPPAPQDASFQGVATAPDELLDLQMALTPPEPAQEGFAGASDAPVAAPAPSLSLSAPGGHDGLSLAAAQAISMETWAFSSSPAGGGSSARGAAAVHVENLHLPAASANEFADQLLAGCPDLTNADLSGWKS